MRNAIKLLLWCFAIGALAITAIAAFLGASSSHNAKELAPATAAAPAPFPATEQKTVTSKKAVKRHESAFEAVDRLIDRMPLANLAFNVPTTLTLGEPEAIHLKLSLAETVERLKQQIEATGAKEGARIAVSERMEARLSGKSFTITAVTPEVQAVSQHAPTEWKWDIAANEEGNQVLHLTLSALVSVDGISTPYTVRTFDKLIVIEVNWQRRIAEFAGKNWQWLWGTILIPVVGWLWRTLRRRRNAGRT